LTESIPVILNRFKYVMLGYAFVRERIIYNNTLASFAFDLEGDSALDAFYIDQSVRVERDLTALKYSEDSILTEVAEMLKNLDSEQFCADQIGDLGNVTATNAMTDEAKDKMIANYCSDFGDGLLKKGIQQALGNF